MIKIERLRLRRLSKEAFWIVLGQAAVVVGALFGVRILTNLLDPTQYGDLALGLTVGTLVNQLIMAPLANGFSRFYAPALERRHLSDYMRACRQLMIGATATVGLLFLVVIAGFAAWGQPQWLSLAVASFTLALLNGYSGAVSGIQTAARQRSVVAVHDGAYMWLRFLLAAALIVYLGASSTTAMIGFALAALFVLGSQLVFLAKLNAPHLGMATHAVTWRTQIWQYSWPFAAWGIFTWAQSASDRWAIEAFRSTREVGLYAVLFQLGYYPISLSTGMATQFLAPIFFQRAGDGTDPIRNANVHALALRVVQFSLFLAALAFSVALLLHKQIFQLFSRSDYLEISYLLPWAILSGGFFSAGQALALKLLSELRSRTLTAAKILTALFGVAANVLGAYYDGISGVVIAGLLFSTSYFLSMLILVRGTTQHKLA